MKYDIELYGVFDRLWNRENAFDKVSELSGEVFRQVKTRRTFRIEVEGSGFFVKHHLGVGWREIFKNLSQFKLPVLGAENELRALKALHRAGVHTMTVAAYGCRSSWDPAAVESFIITAELADTINLEDLTRGWRASPPPAACRIAAVKGVAVSAGTMHRCCMNHRDCYICHYLVPRDAGAAELLDPAVIDLHRAQIRKKVPRRYLVKDLAGLMFSAFDSGLNRHDALRFIKYYAAGVPLREELRKNRRLWQDVSAAARRLYRKEFGKEAPELFF